MIKRKNEPGCFGRRLVGLDPIVLGCLTGAVSTKQARRVAKLPGFGGFEARYDLFDKVAKFEKILGDKKLADSAILFTDRSTKEGGKTDPGDVKGRARVIRRYLPYVNGVDIELSSPEVIARVVQVIKEARKMLVISYHNFKRTPSLRQLNKICRQAVALGADVVKVATMIREADFPRADEDCRVLTIFMATHLGLVQKAVIGMGKAGGPTRVFFPYLGSVLVYASVGPPTAEGQFSVEEMLDIFAKIKR